MCTLITGGKIITMADPLYAQAVVVENGYSGQRGAPVARAVFNEYFGLNEEDIQQQNTDGQLIP